MRPPAVRSASINPPARIRISVRSPRSPGGEQKTAREFRTASLLMSSFLPAKTISRVYGEIELDGAAGATINNANSSLR